MPTAVDPPETKDQEALSEAAAMAEAEARMEKITEEHFAQKEQGDVEIEEEEPKTTVEAPKEEAAATPPEERKDDAQAILDAKEPIVEEKKEAAEPPEPTDEDFEKEIESVKLRKGAHPNTEKALKVLKEKAKREHKEKVEARNRIKELEAAQANIKLLDEPTEKELQELRTFKRNLDIEHDPEFTDKYVKGIQTLDEQAMGTLKVAGLPESTAKFITDNGGALRFKSSNGLMPRGIKDANDQLIQHADGTPLSHAEFYEKHILPVLTTDQKEELTAIGLEARNLVRERDKQLIEAKQKGDELFKQRAEQAQKNREQWIADVTESLKKSAEDLGEVAKKKEVPSNATAVEKALIDAHNARIDRAAGIAKRLMSDLNPKNLGEMAITKAFHETAFKDLMSEKDTTIKDQAGQIAKLEKEIDEIKNAGKTSNRTSAPATGTEKPKSVQDIADPEERMNAMMNQTK
jgi:hypothetical protein